MKNWIYIFLPILLLTALASLISLLTPDFYFRDSAMMAVKCYYLDVMTIGIILPVGVFLFIRAIKDSYRARLALLGMMAYLGFMYGFNAMSLFFNELFLVYVAIFGLNIFGIILGYGETRQSGTYWTNQLNIKISGAILLLFAVSVSTLWLIETISATLNDSIPDNIAGMNIPASVVYVFDLAIALPVIFIGAILLFRSRMSGLVISSISAVFVFFVCLSLLTMELGLKHQGIAGDVGKFYYVLFMGPVSVFPLIALFRVTKNPQILD